MVAIDRNRLIHLAFANCRDLPISAFRASLRDRGMTGSPEFYPHAFTFTHNSHHALLREGRAGPTSPVSKGTATQLPD